MKAAPLIRALAGTRLATRVVHTGQHYDAAMSDVFLRQLGIAEPDVHLEVGSGSHGEQTARVLQAFEKYLANSPVAQRGVVVVGDVNSTMACAITAAKMQIPVAHIEAGLRSFDRAMPEEINRLLTDAVADLLFVSEPSGIRNLEREGVPASKVHYAGNVMIDTLVHELDAAIDLNTPAGFGLCPNGYVLATLHRPANVDQPERLNALVELLSRVSEKLPVIFPSHPRTRTRLVDAGLMDRLASNPRITIADPLGYRENLGLMKSARAVLTDSGGIQEETSYLGVPCLTLRSNTERPVTISHGTNLLVGDDLDLAYQEILHILAGDYRKGQPIDGWDGRAAERIAEVLDACWGYDEAA
jgi:UDP-N-acetylglucosamine 2-epimerase (non-hydrolysing)